MPSVRGAGSARRVELTSGRDVAITVDSTDDRGRAAAARLAAIHRPGAFRRARFAVLASRGAYDARPAQGRVGVHSRHDSQRASSHSLLSVVAPVASDGIRPRRAAPVDPGPGGVPAAVRSSLHRSATASVRSTHQLSWLDADRAGSDAGTGAQGGHRGRTPSVCPPRQRGTRPRGKGVRAA
jgi:hypothetical protein